jgi:hypothetical protein
MTKLRENWTSGDNTNLWDHLNQIGQRTNPFIQKGTINDTSLLNGGSAMWGGSVQLDRVGDWVSAQGYVTVQAGSSFIGSARDGSAPITIPTGFQPIYRAYGIALGSGMIGSSFVGIYWSVATGRLAVANPGGGNWAAGQSLAFNCVWRTNEAPVGLS